MMGLEELSEEDAAIRDARENQIRQAQERLDFSRRTQAVQRGLPRPTVIDIAALEKSVSHIDNPILAEIAQEASLLIANDALKYPPPAAKVRGASKPLQTISDDDLANARLMIALEVPADLAEKGSETFKAAWADAHNSSLLPGLSAYGEEDEVDEHQMLVEAFDVSPLPLSSKPNII